MKLRKNINHYCSHKLFIFISVSGRVLRTDTWFHIFFQSESANVRVRLHFKKHRLFETGFWVHGKLFDWSDTIAVSLDLQINFLESFSIKKDPGWLKSTCLLLLRIRSYIWRRIQKGEILWEVRGEEKFAALSNYVARIVFFTDAILCITGSSLRDITNLKIVICCI